MSCQVAAYISSIDVHTSIFTTVLMACTFIFIPVFSWSLFSIWLFQENVSTMYRSAPGSYVITYCIGEQQHDAL